MSCPSILFKSTGPDKLILRSGVKSQGSAIAEGPAWAMFQRSRSGKEKIKEFRCRPTILFIFLPIGGKIN